MHLAIVMQIRQCLEIYFTIHDEGLGKEQLVIKPGSAPLPICLRISSRRYMWTRNPGFNNVLTYSHNVCLYIFIILKIKMF